jgi:hypothetical protein
MDNKVLVCLKVPEIDRLFDVYLPVNKKIGNILILINKFLNDYTSGSFPITSNIGLFNLDTRELYSPDTLLINTSIRNGTKLMILVK